MAVAQNPYAVLAGVGYAAACMPVPGLGAINPAVVTRWPADRRQGLTYGELAEIDNQLRNRLLPPIYAYQGGWKAVTSWFPGAHWAAVDSGAVQDGRNELGETAQQAFREVLTRYEALPENARKAMAGMMSQWFSIWGVQSKVWATADGLIAGNRNVPVQWPINAQNLKANLVLEKAAQIGVEAWLRFVAGIAIGRDLFAEQYQEVGGVQPGLQTTVENLQQQGVAVSGRWEALAGRWVWKGFDVSGRPLLQSNALLPAPMFTPADADFTLGRNAKLWTWMFSQPGDYSQVVNQLLPVMTQRYNELAALARQPAIQEPPATAAALGQLFVAYWNLLGLDFFAQLRQWAGEDFANVVAQQAGATGEGALFVDPVAS